MKRLGIVGATGLVGMSVLNLIEERGLPQKFEIFLFVSDRSDGKVLVLGEKHYPLIKLDENFDKFKLDYAIFLTSESVSEVWAKRFAESGVRVIDNSSAFRMSEEIPLVVPEINTRKIQENDKIIANPNCSTIQLVVVLDELMKLGEIEEVVVSSYQSVSGAGRDALLDLEKGVENFFDCDITKNFIPQIGSIQENGSCTEENKIINETKKILGGKFDVFATTVRVPVPYCHGEAVLVKFKDDVELTEVKNALNQEHIRFSEDLFYPSECAGTDETYVCRLKGAKKNIIQFFVIADNLRRGASFNAIKILENIEKI